MTAAIISLLLVIFIVASFIWPEHLLDGKPWCKRKR